ncbi:MAG TPA: VOC family protein [Clostridiales bacterium]|nr:VOC family protein [Clostridiales bacterium]
MEKLPLGTNIVAQIAFVVNDIEKTAQAYADFLGVEKPPIIMNGTPDKTEVQYMGQPTNARAKLAFFDIGPNIRLELIEPDMEPSTWRNELDKYGEGIHHIAFFIKGMNEKIGILERNGMPLVQKGNYPGGRYAYIDAKEELKTIIELLEND